jgi:hypothetical protein
MSNVTLHPTMKKILCLISSLFILHSAVAQLTPVLFSMQSLTGQTVNRTILMQPDRTSATPLWSGTNLAPVSDFVLQPVNGQVITNLVPWGYTMKVDGWPRSVHIVVAVGTVLTNVISFINTNQFSPLNIYTATIIPTNAPGITQSGNFFFVDTNYEALGLASNLLSGTVIPATALAVPSGSSQTNLNLLGNTTLTNLTGPVHVFGDITANNGIFGSHALAIRTTTVNDVPGLFQLSNPLSGADVLEAATTNGKVAWVDYSGVLNANGSGVTNLQPAKIVPGTAGINVTGSAGTAGLATNAFFVPGGGVINTNPVALTNAANTILGNGVISPIQFGAVGNGVADDSSAINNCLNSATNFGVTVDFMNRFYVINAAPLLITNNYLTLKNFTFITSKTNNFCVVSNMGDYTHFENGFIYGPTNVGTNLYGFNSGQRIGGLDLLSPRWDRVRTVGFSVGFYIKDSDRASLFNCFSMANRQASYLTMNSDQSLMIACYAGFASPSGAIPSYYDWIPYGYGQAVDRTNSTDFYFAATSGDGGHTMINCGGGNSGYAIFCDGGRLNVVGGENEVFFGSDGNCVITITNNCQVSIDNAGYLALSSGNPKMRLIGFYNDNRTSLGNLNFSADWTSATNQLDIFPASQGIPHIINMGNPITYQAHSSWADIQTTISRSSSAAYPNLLSGFSSYAQNGFFGTSLFYNSMGIGYDQSSPGTYTGANTTAGAYYFNTPTAGGSTAGILGMTASSSVYTLQVGGGAARGPTDIEFDMGTVLNTAEVPWAHLGQSSFSPYIALTLGDAGHLWSNAFLGSATIGTLNATNLNGNGSGLTNLNATNLVIYSTNYSAANFTPPAAGQVKFAVSNNWMFSITTFSTNPIFKIGP